MEAQANSFGEEQAKVAGAQGAAPYSLSVAVDEVILTFHVADAHGLPVNDLKLEELRLLDNEKAPDRVLDFQLLRDFPIRAGILVDTSESMRGHLAEDRAISIEYAQRLLRRESDQAFVMGFGRLTRILQPWTGDANALSAGIREVRPSGEEGGKGTAIFDTVYRACRYQFGGVDHAASGNFILLFSDGEDNASSMGLKDAVDMCQRTNTAVYAFRAESGSSVGSTGPGTLAELALQTGGRVFREKETEAGIYDDLRSIEGDMRNQYRLVYKPVEMKHDGSFHRIVLVAPQRVDKVAVRSGYYAPVR
jgi:Ca-activated chloride channel homolog